MFKTSGLLALQPFGLRIQPQPAGVPVLQIAGSMRSPLAFALSLIGLDPITR